MNYWEFKNSFLNQVCINIHQINAKFPGLDKNNLSRWVRQGKLIKLRNAFYSFPEYINASGSQMYIANRIYTPSYVSLHTALSYYGIIPEGVIIITSVTSLKTAEYENGFGTFSYKTIQPKLIFGYQPKPFLSDMTFLLAEPEKAILDLLYIYPFYNSPQEIEELRLDRHIISESVNQVKLVEYAARFNNKALTKRVRILMEEYRIC
ncbi:MAG: hypothetical protein KKD86_16985 [Bacteroidetes bacterium]|nr:hypothetical protein [Bacteroidota bacterium]MBU1680522.1 hypothetical protein [Bacteroidota bacterium]